MLHIVQDAHRGRCVEYQGSGSLPPGTVVFRALPYASVIGDPWCKDRFVCWHCFQFTIPRKKWKLTCSQPTVIKSSPCQAVYCSEECRDQDLSLHSLICPWIQRFRQECTRRMRRKDFTFEAPSMDLDEQMVGEETVNGENTGEKKDPWETHLAQHPCAKLTFCHSYVPDPYLRDLLCLVLHALARRHLEQDLPQSCRNPKDDLKHVSYNDEGNNLDSLVDFESLGDTPVLSRWSDVERIQDNEASYLREQGILVDWRFIFAYQFLRHVVQVPLQLLGPDSRWFRAVLFREMANSFGIWDTRDTVNDSSELLGFALYPRAVFFNHSCRGNVAKRMQGNVLEFLTTAEITSGTELCIEYGYVDQTCEMRQERLRREYFFHCRCRRCEEEADGMVLRKDQREPAGK